MQKYIGHPHQICGIEEFILNNGKGKGMRILHAFNGKGLELYILPDRCLDISKVVYKGTNVSYISPAGYVAPQFYSKKSDEFLRSFTAGFLTTCGLENTGVPCVDNGEDLPMHGSIHNTPAEHYFYTENENELIVSGTIRDEVIFGRKLILKRNIIISKNNNTFKIIDNIKNTGDRIEPFEILYHINMGYPLLDEESIVKINSESVIGRNKHAQDDIINALKMTAPEVNYIERCYYHKITEKIGTASIYQPKINIGLKIEYDTSTLDRFIQWKMLGYRDYVLGLECANCYPDGRNIMREKNILKFINPNEEMITNINVSFFTQ